MAAVDRIPPDRLHQIDRHGDGDRGHCQRLVAAHPGERFRAEQRRCQWVDQEKLALKGPRQSRCAVEQRAAEAELHEHQHAGEHHPRDGRKQPSAFGAQLPPGEADGQERAHGRIATCTCMLVRWRNAIRPASSNVRRTSTERASTAATGSEPACVVRRTIQPISRTLAW